MIDEKDVKLVPKKTPGHFRKTYKAICNECKSDRGYIDKCDADKLCRKCTRVNVHKNMAPEMKQKLSESATKQFTGSTPWNKGQTDVYSQELKKQWSEKHKEINSSETFRKKMSCTKRNIALSDFEEFSSSIQERERAQITSFNLQKQCFQRDNYTCKKCLVRGVKLHAHHMNSFDKFPDERFNLTNLVTLCEQCHSKFHLIFGRGTNTKDQLDIFLKNKKTLLVLAGPSGSGKTWIVSQLKDFDIVDADKSSFINDLKVAENPIVSITVGVSTFIRSNPHLEIQLILIKETEDIIKQRLEHRGGIFTNGIKKRIARFTKLEKVATFSGTSEEVLNYLKK